MVKSVIHGFMVNLAGNVKKFIFDKIKSGLDAAGNFLSDILNDPLKAIEKLKELKTFSWSKSWETLKNNLINGLIKILNEKKSSLSFLSIIFESIISGLNKLRTKESFLLLTDQEEFKYLKQYIGTEEYFIVFQK